MNISVVIIVKNGASTLAQCLDSLDYFDDIVIYNNGSTDDTVAITSHYKNVNVVEGEFIGFGSTKNIAATYAKNNWILSIDADEVLNEVIVQEILNLSNDPKIVYSLLRKNFYKQTEIRHCWGNDEIVRIYNRTLTHYSSDNVHEYVLTDGLIIQKLHGYFSHFTYQSISEFILKVDLYSTLFATDNVGKKNASLLKALLNAKYAFFKTYFLKMGFLDGYPGLIISFSHMATNFYKYMKLYEMNLELEKWTNSNSK
ncbi:glycosyltransferase family 2 protein [Sulfuricurvum sp.]|uniref:glycosyltransferase family 2 protein n=1 Tax=Sulfuricurvum sp. TaxID=2025608 RepID=UPI003563FA52